MVNYLVECETKAFDSAETSGSALQKRNVEWFDDIARAIASDWCVVFKSTVICLLWIKEVGSKNGQRLKKNEKFEEKNVRSRQRSQRQFKQTACCALIPKLLKKLLLCFFNCVFIPTCWRWQRSLNRDFAVRLCYFTSRWRSNELAELKASRGFDSSGWWSTGGRWFVVGAGRRCEARFCHRRHGDYFADCKQATKKAY